MVGLLGTMRTFENERRALPQPAPIRALTKAVRELGGMGSEERIDAEPWEEFIARINPADPAGLARRDLKRLSAELWSYSELEAFAPGLLDYCAKLAKRGLDRRLARAYWNRFRGSVTVFDLLGQYCASRGATLGSPWTGLGVAISVWDCQRGPKELGSQLFSANKRAALLEKTNLSSSDLQGGFVEAAFEAQLMTLANRPALQPVPAQDEGHELLSFVTSLGDGTIKANATLLAYILLKPWLNAVPEESYRDKVMEFLFANISDPRTAQNDWDTRARTLENLHRLSDASDVLRVFHHWVTEKTVRLFFDLIAKTTDRPDQWEERRAFWESYLENRAVERAWFALGQQARGLAQVTRSSIGLTFGKVGGAGAASSQSVLLMKIGDLVIAEWSDNGRARFWNADSPQAPKFNKRYYEGQTLRSMSGGIGFEAIAHQGRWYRKFAGHISKITGVAYKGPRPMALWGW